MHYDHVPLFRFCNHWYLIHDAASLVSGARRSGYFRSVLFKHFISRQYNIVTVSNTTKNKLVDLGIIPRRFIVSYNSSEFLCLQSKKLDLKYDICIVTSGADHKRDQIAIRELLKMGCSICLISNNETFLNQYRDENGVSLKYAPTEQEKYELLLRSKYYLTYSSIEGFGITVLEALCCNCICIITDLPVFRELYGLSSNVHFLDQEVEISKQISDLFDKNFSFIPEHLEFPRWALVADQLHDKFSGFLLSDKQLGNKR